MSLNPLALSILGMDSNNSTVERQRQEILAREDELGAPISRLIDLRSSNRPSVRRVTSYSNSFQTICTTSTDAPPSYQSKVAQQPAITRPLQHVESLPGYECSVNAEGHMLALIESVNPLHDLGEGYWKEVYAVVRGTMLLLYRIKDKRQGRILRSYTLQHAEIGLAIDTEHVVLVPQTKLAHLVPPLAREKAWRRDNKMYKAERQHILRLRVEMDQFLLANPSEELVHDFIEALSAGIDIAHPIDERSQSKQCTMPRRRRRTRAPQPNNDINDPALQAEQERIMRQHFPGLMANAAVPAIDATTEQAAQAASRPTPQRLQTQASTREDEELDLSLLVEDASPTEPGPSRLRPSITRLNTASTTASNIQELVTLPTNLDIEGKWAPPHNRSAAQAQRYIRRCLPLLNADAIRASDVLIRDGKRVKINWRMLLLEEWELSPPSYASHVKKPRPTPLERTVSQGSSVAASTVQQSPRETEDEIMPLGTPTIEVSQQGAELVKTISNYKDSNKPMPAPIQQRIQEDSKAIETRPTDDANSHGVVFCF